MQKTRHGRRLGFESGEVRRGGWSPLPAKGEGRCGKLPGSLDHVETEVGLDDVGDGTDLQCEGRSLEGWHHLSGAKLPEVAPRGGGSGFVRPGAGQGGEVFSRPCATEHFFRPRPCFFTGSGDPCGSSLRVTVHHEHMPGCDTGRPGGTGRCRQCRGGGQRRGFAGASVAGQGNEGEGAEKEPLHGAGDG